ncbi:MAG: glycerol-3-phosphate 1-O-acyltransferase PlsY [Steroidobacteraceae bacterium]
MHWIAYLLLAYLIGSIVGSLVLGLLRGVDIRGMGSGNAGGTNALRTQGKWFALGVMLIDVGKAWLAVRWLPQLPLPDVAAMTRGEWLPAACGFAAIAGHVWPVYFGFRGGKGVAPLVGALAALSIGLLWKFLLVWLIVVTLTGFVSLGSMVASASLVPLAVLASGPANSSLPGFAIAAALLILWCHRTNLRRMRTRREPRAQKLWLFGRRSQ